MQKWAESFYKSKAWRECRDAYFVFRHGLCERCGTVKQIHFIWVRNGGSFAEKCCRSTRMSARSTRQRDSTEEQRMCIMSFILTNIRSMLLWNSSNCQTVRWSATLLQCARIVMRQYVIQKDWDGIKKNHWPRKGGEAMKPKKILYKCDPNKNTQCKKKSCFLNKNAKPPKEGRKMLPVVCRHTRHIEFSLDGKPIEIWWYPRSRNLRF